MRQTVPRGLLDINQNWFFACYLPPYPTHHGNGHAVADCFVARTVRAVRGGFAAPRDERVVIGEALQAFAFNRRESAYLQAV